MHDDRKVFVVASDKVMAINVVWENPSKEDLQHHKQPAFKTTDLTIAPDDLVVCETALRHNMGVFKVIATKVRVDLRSTQPLPWVVCKIDRKAHNANKFNEAKLTSMLQDAEEQRLREEMAKDLLEGIGEADVKAITFGDSK